MAYLGSWKIDDNLTFTVNTHTTAGIASDADAAPTYRVYEDETATPILTGTMALLDAANTVGWYSEQIALTAANGLEQGKSYNIYVTATVGTNIGTIGHSFQIGAEVNTTGLALEANVAGHVTTSLNSYDPPTKAELDTAVSGLAVEANVVGHVTTSLNSYDPPTKTEMDSGLAALNDVTAAEVVTALMAKTGITAGGAVTYANIIKALYAAARGKIAKSGDAYTFYDDDNTTALFTLTVAASQRTVA